MEYSTEFPRQNLSFKSKGLKWRKQCVSWAASKSYFTFSPVRTSVVKMKTNYDLVNGIIHMEDIARILNPDNLSTLFVPEKIQHYPIINAKMNMLRGEEAARIFDWHAIVTNPESVSQIAEEKKAQFDEAIRRIVEDPTLDQEAASEKTKEVSEYFKYNWQSIREVRANRILNHYSRKLNFKQIFNDGFMDALTVAQEIYNVDIVGGEPHIERLNPMKMRAFGTGYSSNIEDADIIIYEDYWSRGRILEEFYDELKPKDIEWLNEEVPDFGGQNPRGAAGNYNEAYGFFHDYSISGENGILIDSSSSMGFVFDSLSMLDGGIGSDLIPYDVAGNVRVMRMWWKSMRKILKVKSYDPITGEEAFDFYPETYVPDTDAGEEATPLWINQAWEGTLIGEDIYVRMRPCLVQSNSMSNPSKCNFGIIGTIYNFNEAKPYSLVDMMKPYNYLYDAVHAKLVDLIATNWGKLIEFDLSLKPKGWEVEKWMYFARANKALIKDSFNEGTKGAATGKLAGGLNNATKGYVDADWGNSIQNYMNILQWTKDSMSDLVGINRQREGSIQNRETVGGVERAVLQSSYITDWLFQKHEDTKKRVLEAFIERAKIAGRGRNITFQYILGDGSMELMDIDGDEFAESDYGIIVDNSSDTQRLYQRIDGLAESSAQNGMRLSALMKLYTSTSLAEKARMIEKAEEDMDARREQEQQMQQQTQQQIAQMQQQTEMQKMQLQDALNKRDNDTKIEVARLNAQAEYLRLGIYADENNEELRREELDIQREKLRADIMNFDKELRQKDKELDQKKEIELKKIAAQQQASAAKARSNNK